MAIIIRVYPTHEKEKRVEKNKKGAGGGGRVKRSQEDALYIERHQVSPHLSRNDGLSRRRRIRPTSFASCMPSRRESGVLNVFQYAPLPYVLVGILADYGVYEALGICIVFNLGSM